MTFEEIADRLRGRLFLSSMMGSCDAAFCASRAKGCAMVQFGAFVLLDGRQERSTYWPDPSPATLADFMRGQFAAYRASAAALVGEDAVPLISANVFPCEDRDAAASASAFVEAGGHLYELNAHGGIGNDRQRGTGHALFFPEHRPRLRRWASLIVASGGPVIVKARGGVIPDFTEPVKELEQLGVQAFHLNVRNEKKEQPDLRLLQRVRRATGMFLLASGYVTDAASARAMFEAGADAVGIATAALTDAEIFVKCQGEKAP